MHWLRVLDIRNYYSQNKVTSSNDPHSYNIGNYKHNNNITPKVIKNKQTNKKQKKIVLNYLTLICNIQFNYMINIYLKPLKRFRNVSHMGVGQLETDDFFYNRNLRVM